jgi:tRNA G18 (ribose-2'-O)-methylase SpoU
MGTAYAAAVSAPGSDPPIEQSRHKPPTTLERPRGILPVCDTLRSRVNLSTILRAAGCCGIERIIACGSGKVDPTVARDSVEHVEIEVRRSLLPVLKKLKAEGYTLVGLEQTTRSVDLHTYAFPYRTALVIGNERTGIGDAELEVLDVCVEIPVWGMPYSYNVATATSMALYEYCKQFPRG